MHTVFALLCFVVVIHWLIFPYPSGLLHWHCGNLTIAPVPAKQPWWIWINSSCEFIMNDCITTTKQSTTKPCAYFLGYTVWRQRFWATLVYVTTYCRTAPRHYLNQCWLIITVVHGIHLRVISQESLRNLFHNIIYTLHNLMNALWGPRSYFVNIVTVTSRERYGVSIQERQTIWSLLPGIINLVN